MHLHNVASVNNETTEQAQLTSAETCARLNIDRSTLSRWVAAGRITPSIKLPGIRGPFLFDRSEVERVANGGGKP